MEEEGEEEAAALSQNTTKMWDNTEPTWLSVGWAASPGLLSVIQTHNVIFFPPSFVFNV